MFFGDGSSVTTSATTDHSSHECYDVVLSGEEFGALPFLDFSTSGQLDSLPIDSFGACMSSVGHENDTTQPLPEISATPAAPQQPCDCAKRVFDTIRSLSCEPMSHNTIHKLRLGADLFEELLTCPRCYDISKPPRITLQNVLLIGRLSLEITAGYQNYIKWLKDYCNELSGRNMADTVYLSPGIGISSALGIRISSDKLFDLVSQGLQADAERLSDLGKQFSTRQRNRHLIGHGACPDSEGRCWKEKDDVNPDPSDVCPQSAAARALIPCYRVVDEVRSKIRQFEDSVQISVG